MKNASFFSSLAAMGLVSDKVSGRIAIPADKSFDASQYEDIEKEQVSGNCRDSAGIIESVGRQVSNL